MRGHVSANGVRGANRRCDCDGYRPDTLGDGIEFIAAILRPPKQKGIESGLLLGDLLAMVICAIRNALLAVSLVANIVAAEEYVSNVSLIRGDTERQAAAQRKGSASPLGAVPGDRLLIETDARERYVISVTEARKSSHGNSILRGSVTPGSSSLLVVTADGRITGHIEHASGRLQVDTDAHGVTRIWKPDPYTVSPFRGNDAVRLPEELQPLAQRGRYARDSQAVSSLKNPIPETPPTVIYPAFATGAATVRVFFYHDFKNISPRYVSSIIDYLIEYTNDVFKNSKVNLSLELAGSVAIDLEGAVSGDILSDMSMAEGAFTSINEDSRDNRASLTAVLRDVTPEDDDAFGKAFIGGKFLTQSHSVSGYTKSNDASTFTHEIGHNLGAAHNRGEYTEEEMESNKFNFSYAYGFYEPGQHRTIMSYLTYGWVPLVDSYSNPEVKFNGYALGAPFLREDSADVSRALFNNRHVAAARGSDMSHPGEAVQHRVSIYESSCGEDLGEEEEKGKARLHSVSIHNDGIEINSKHRVTPAGWDYVYRYPPASTGSSSYDCRLPDEGDNSLGTEYLETFFRYRLPTGEVVETGHVPWQKDYEGTYAEIRIGHTDGGRVVGKTHLFSKDGQSHVIEFERDFGFELMEINSTCDGQRVGNTYELTANRDGCRIEAIFGQPAGSSQLVQDLFLALLGSAQSKSIYMPSPPPSPALENEFAGTYHETRDGRPGDESLVRIGDGSSLTWGRNSGYRWEERDEYLDVYYMLNDDSEDSNVGDYALSLSRNLSTGGVQFFDKDSGNNYVNQGEKLSPSSDFLFDLFKLGRGYGGAEEDILKCYNEGNHARFQSVYWNSESKLPISSRSLEECQSYCAEVLADYQEREPEEWEDRVCEGNETDGG